MAFNFRETEILAPARDFPYAEAGRADIGPILEPYRRELQLHCYRLLGSLHDAEDAVQETMLRAWRHHHTFTQQGTNSLRSWLYTIATNTCLDALKKRGPRLLPMLSFPVADPAVLPAARNAEVAWLEPFPDTWLTEMTENPEARYTRHESISLAFLTALQLLPHRQRAILILSDVLDWHAAEVAQLLGITVSAVSSALRRARVTLEKNYHNSTNYGSEPVAGKRDAALNNLLSRYLQAWEADDVDGLVALLKEDGSLSMPPVPSWYLGHEAIRAIFTRVVFRKGRKWRLLPTWANEQAAFAVYQLDEATGKFLAYGVQVVSLDLSKEEEPRVADITAFLNPRLVTTFGFPAELSFS